MKVKSMLTTLCYIEKGDSYLMLHRIKKESDVNKDKWIGVGGHFEEDESPEDCLLREVKEETGLTLTSYKFRGIVTFIFKPLTGEPDTEYMCLYTGMGAEKRSAESEPLGGGQDILQAFRGGTSFLFPEINVPGRYITRGGVRWKTDTMIL